MHKKSRQERFTPILAELEDSLRVMDKQMEDLVDQINSCLPHRHNSLMLRVLACGKANCLSCPHGPYVYRMIRQTDGTWRSKYVGAELTFADGREAGLKFRVIKEARKLGRRIARLKKARGVIVERMQKALRLLMAAQKSAWKQFSAE